MIHSYLSSVSPLIPCGGSIDIRAFDLQHPIAPALGIRASVPQPDSLLSVSSAIISITKWDQKKPSIQQTILYTYSCCFNQLLSRFIHSPLNGAFSLLVTTWPLLMLYIGTICYLTVSIFCFLSLGQKKNKALQHGGKKIHNQMDKSHVPYPTKWEDFDN